MIFCFLVGIDFAQILHFIDVFRREIIRVIYNPYMYNPYMYNPYMLIHVWRYCNKGLCFLKQ